MAENLNFSAVVGDWAKETEDRLERIFKASVQELVVTAINRTPVDTGFSRASWRVSSEAMPQIIDGSRGKDGQSYSVDFGELNGAVSGARLGTTLYAGITASYAIYLEYGHSKQAPQGFVRISAAEWPTIVGQVVAEAKSRAA